MGHSTWNLETNGRAARHREIMGQAALEMAIHPDRQWWIWRRWWQRRSVELRAAAAAVVSQAVGVAIAVLPLVALVAEAVALCDRREFRD